MKKILSFVLMLTMLLSMTAFSTSAAGVVVQSNFSDMTLFTSNFHAGAFYTEDNLLFGYAEAKCLQSKGEWFVYDTTIEVCLADDELSDAGRGFSLWYCNTNLENYGRFNGTDYMRFGYDADNKAVYLTADDPITTSNMDLVDRVPYELSDDEFHTFGLSVTRGRLRGFINGELVIDYVDTEDTYLIGLQDEYTISTPLVYWNDGNFIQIRDVKIATAEYLFPITDDTPVVTPTETTSITTADLTLPTEVPTEIITSVSINDEGETEIISDVVTVATTPSADTNTGAPENGNSTNTGDSFTFVVIAAMVAALGCAIVVKKVYVK